MIYLSNVIRNYYHLIQILLWPFGQDTEHILYVNALRILMIIITIKYIYIKS